MLHAKRCDEMLVVVLLTSLSECVPMCAHVLEPQDGDGKQLKPSNLSPLIDDTSVVHCVWGNAQWSRTQVRDQRTHRTLSVDKNPYASLYSFLAFALH